MRARARFRTLCGLLGLTLALSVFVAVDSIQRDLLVRSQHALAASGLAFYGLELQGRDVLLHGFVSSSNESRRIEQVIRTVPGVAHVRNELVVERVADATRAAGAHSGSVSPLPSLRWQGLGSHFVISGILPDDGSLDDLMRALLQRYGRGNVSSRAVASDAVGRAGWLDAIPRLLDLMSTLDGNARLVITGHSAHLFGQVEGRRQRHQVQRSALRIGGLQWRFDLVARDGSTGGDAP